MTVTVMNCNGAAHVNAGYCALQSTIHMKMFKSRIRISTNPDLKNQKRKSGLVQISKIVKPGLVQI